MVVCKSKFRFLAHLIVTLSEANKCFTHPGAHVQNQAKPRLVSRRTEPSGMFQDIHPGPFLSRACGEELIRTKV